MKRAPVEVGSFPLETVNFALDLSLEWGENWLCPINARLLAVEPQWSAEQAEILNAWCVEVREFAWAQIAPFYASAEEGRFERAMETTRRKYPQVSQANLARLYNQGMYYAWRG